MRYLVARDTGVVHTDDRLDARSRLTALMALGVLVATLIFALASPASARRRDGFEVTPTKSAEAEYPALVGVNPQNEANVNTPSYCVNVTFCDLIAFTVTPPEGLGEDDSFYVTITVSWADPNKQNDVDVYVYDNGQLQGGSATRMGKSTTSNNPEKVDVQQPTLGEYQLVVVNANGVNNGYKVTAKMFRAKFESPVEQLAPPKEQPPPASSTDTTEARPKESLEPAAAGAGGPASTLAPVPVEHDDSLDFSASDFNREVSQIGEDEFLAPPALRQPGPAEAPSGLVLVLWFVVVPIVLVAAAVAFVYRRRRALLFAT